MPLPDFSAHKTGNINAEPLIELNGAATFLPRCSKIPALLDELREGLGTSEMSLEEMVLEMRRIRESSDYAEL